MYCHHSDSLPHMVDDLYLLGKELPGATKRNVLSD